jgi:hypothetical protein
MKELLSVDIPKIETNHYPFGSERAFHNVSSMKTYEVHWSHPKSVDSWCCVLKLLVQALMSAKVGQT